MPLACFKCADTFAVAAKHAEGMSLRYDDACTILILADRFGCYP